MRSARPRLGSASPACDRRCRGRDERCHAHPEHRRPFPEAAARPPCGAARLHDHAAPGCRLPGAAPFRRDSLEREICLVRTRSLFADASGCLRPPMRPRGLPLAMVEERERDAPAGRCVYPARPGAVGPDPTGIAQGKDGDPGGNEVLEHASHGHMELYSAVQRGISGEPLEQVAAQGLLAAEKRGIVIGERSPDPSSPDPTRDRRRCAGFPNGSQVDASAVMLPYMPDTSHTGGNSSPPADSRTDRAGAPPLSPVMISMPACPPTLPNPSLPRGRCLDTRRSWSSSVAV